MFVRLALKARQAQKRIQKIIAAMFPSELGQELRDAKAAGLRAEEVSRTATEQLVHASGRVPKKARTRLAMTSFAGPCARQDAERAEKGRWLAHLAALLMGTQTPLGQRLVEKPAACNSIGMGLRSGTLRNRVHVLRLYFAWQAMAHQVPFSSPEEHVLDYLELKVQETVHSSSFESGAPEHHLSRGDHGQASLQQPLRRNRPRPYREQSPGKHCTLSSGFWKQ